MVMYECTITISSIDMARAFVDMINKYKDIKVDLIYENYCIDAHSIIGLLSLDFSKPITLKAKGDINENFKNDLKPYTI